MHSHFFLFQCKGTSVFQIHKMCYLLALEKLWVVNKAHNINCTNCGSEWLPLSDILRRDHHLQCASLVNVFFHLHTAFRFPHPYTKKKRCHKWCHHCAVNINFTQNCSKKIVWGLIKNSVSLIQSKPWLLKKTAKQVEVCLHCKCQHKLASN